MKISRLRLFLFLAAVGLLVIVMMIIIRVDLARSTNEREATIGSILGGSSTEWYRVTEIVGTMTAKSYTIIRTP